MGSRLGALEGGDMKQADSAYILEMRGVVKEFPGVKALDGVNLCVRPGKVHVICGENGAGKSTLMKVLNGTYTADSGEIYFNEKKSKTKQSNRL
jgi:ABC-type sugar transport system ATPase subunit